MEAKAILSFADNPGKFAGSLTLSRGKRQGMRFIALRFMPYRGADIVEKILKSAMANAEQKKAVNPEDMNVKAFCKSGAFIEES